jgi:Xaa-Pro aminopeptidase
MTLIQEKVQQAVQILNEKTVDAWLTFVRETSGVRDPVMDFIFGPADLTWESILLITRTGDRLAIVGRFEADAVSRLDVYDTVTGYDESIRPHLTAALEKIQPQTIAINTSRNNVHADGLTHGLYEILRDYLTGTPYADRLVSSEEIINALRGRKTPAEAERIRKAVATTAMIYGNTFEFMQVGMTEEQLGTYMHEQVAKLGLGTAWSYDGCPIVNAGPESQVGHANPTGLKVQPGQIIHFDFGVKQEDYCSDIQRFVYVLRPGETEPPAEVRYGFDVIRRAIESARAALKPGATGKDVDAAARSIVTGAGFPEYKYATGHQLGRVAHDGGALLGPLWERYGDSPNQKIEAGQVYTLEPGLVVPGYGYIGLEEDVIITETGAEYLGDPQTEILTMKA